MCRWLPPCGPLHHAHRIDSPNFRGNHSDAVAIFPVRGNNFSFCRIFLSDAKPYCASTKTSKPGSSTTWGLLETQHELPQIHHFLFCSHDHRERIWYECPCGRPTSRCAAHADAER